MQPKKTTSDGSSADYYVLPQGATQLQDLISHRNMNAQIGEIFRAAYRYGQASHSDQLRDAKKMLFYAHAEVRRLERLIEQENEQAKLQAFISPPEMAWPDLKYNPEKEEGAQDSTEAAKKAAAAKKHSFDSFPSALLQAVQITKQLRRDQSTIISVDSVYEALGEFRVSKHRLRLVLGLLYPQFYIL